MGEEIKNILTNIKEVFLLCKKDYPNKIKSKHWDIFSKNFVQIFDYELYWENFVNNQEGNTSIQMWGKQMDKILLDKKFLNNKKKTDYKINPVIKKKILFQFNSLKKITGIKFIKEFHEGKIGNPKSLYYKGMFLNYRDMFALYHAWTIKKKLKNFLKDEPVFLEIGSGLGNLSVKLKKLFPKSTIILIDLPEVNCIQRFYHWKNFPNAKIYDYKQYKKNGLSGLFKQNYDFAFLPPWVISNVKNQSIDLAINIRSMMEMDLKTVEDYMFHINRIVKVNGFFYCVNRYEKKSSDFPIRIKEYPFDNYWYFIESKSSEAQNWIHELLARRTSMENAYPPKKILNDLHPLGLKHIYLNLLKILCIIKNIIYTNDHRTYSHSLNYLLKILLIPIRSRLKIRTRLKKFLKLV